jgi:hypothetical protein
MTYTLYGEICTEMFGNMDRPSYIYYVIKLKDMNNNQLLKALETVSKEFGTKEFKSIAKGFGLRISQIPAPPPTLPKLELVKEEWLGYSIEPYTWNGVDFYVRDVYTRNDEYRMVIIDEGMRETPLRGNRTAFSRYDYTGYIELIIKKKAKVRNGLHSVTLHCSGNYTNSKKWNRFVTKGSKEYYHYELPTSELLNPKGLITRLSKDIEQCVNLVCESHNITIQKRNETK